MMGLVGVLLAAESAPHAEGSTLTVGSGLGFLGSMPTASLFGGGFRGGLPVGQSGASLFLGGSFSRASWRYYDPEEEDDFTETQSVLLLSATTGLRHPLASGSDLAQPYVVGGLLFTWLELTQVYEEGNSEQSDTLAIRTGAGGFAGGGADVPIADRVSVGVEVGIVAAPVTIREDWSNDFDGHKTTSKNETDATGVWTYADVHAVFRMGGGS